MFVQVLLFVTGAGVGAGAGYAVAHYASSDTIKTLNAEVRLQISKLEAQAKALETKAKAFEAKIKAKL